MNNEKIKVSVIMANYSKAKYLPESIESVLCQTYENLELIIIDDYSDDNSEKIIKYYANKDSRIIPIFNNRNKGPAPSRNQGLRIASGDYIAVLDSDDIALPCRIEKQVNFLENNPNIFLIGSAVIIINEDGQEINRIYCVAKPSLLAKRLTITTTHTIYHSTVMFRNTKEFFYREKIKYSHDYDLYLRMVSSNRLLANLNKVLVKKREHLNTIAYLKKDEQLKFCKLVNEYYYQRITKGRDNYGLLDENKLLSYSISSSEQLKMNTILPRSSIEERQILELFFKEKLKECEEKIKEFLKENKFNSLLSKFKIIFLLIACKFSMSVHFVKKMKMMKNKISWNIWKIRNIVLRSFY